MKNPRDPKTVKMFLIRLPEAILLDNDTTTIASGIHTETRINDNVNIIFVFKN